MVDPPQYSVCVACSTGVSLEISIDFGDDEPVDVVCGNAGLSNSSDPSQDYFMIRTLSGSALFFPLGGFRFDDPIRLMPGTRIDRVGCHRDRIFLASSSSLHILLIDERMHNFVDLHTTQVQSPIHQLFPSTRPDVLCYILTVKYELYSYQLTPSLSVPELVKYGERVLRADCVEDCLAVLTKDRSVYTFFQSSDFSHATKPTTSDPQNGDSREHSPSREAECDLRIRTRCSLRRQKIWDAA
jgi:hypothetical protein